MDSKKNIKPISISEQLRISVTSDCNMVCSYCHNEGEKRCDNMLNFEDVIHIIEISMNHGFKEIRFTGGEPCLHPDLTRLCQYVKKYYPSMKVSINTNGTIFDVIYNLAKNKLIDRLVIGIDFFDSDISKDSSIGISSEIIKNNILKLKKIFPSIGIDTAYCNNKENVIKMIDWCLQNHIYLKILEIVDTNAIKSFEKNDFDVMADEMIEKYKYEKKYDQDGFPYFVDEHNTRIRFIESFCRKKACVNCMSKNIRVTSAGQISRCLKIDKKRFDILTENYKEAFLEALNPMLRL